MVKHSFSALAHENVQKYSNYNRFFYIINKCAVIVKTLNSSVF